METSPEHDVTSRRVGFDAATGCAARKTESASYAEQKTPILRWCESDFPSDADEQGRLSPAPTRLLFVCQSHAILSPMAEGLARDAFRRLAIRVQSAGVQGGCPHACVVSALSAARQSG